MRGPLLAVLGCAALSLGTASPCCAGEGYRAGDVCPDFKLHDSRGSPVNLSGFRGKIVVLHLFASW